MRFISFSLLIALAAMLGHLYLYRRLVRRVAPSRAWRRAGGALLGLMTVLLLLRRPARAFGPDVELSYEIIAYGWLALMLCVLAVVLVSDLALALTGAIRWGHERLTRADQAPADPARRAFLARAVPMGVMAGGGLNAGYGMFTAFAPAEVSELEVKLPGLPPTLEGMSIVQLSDVHVGPFIDREFIDGLVTQTNALKPDLVAITGDLVDGDVRTLGPAVAGLSNLRSRFGTFFVTGNHEYYSGDLAWCAYLEQLGIDVLRNRRVTIGDDGGRFDLLGVDDWGGARRSGGRGYDLDRAMAGRDPERAAVLLAHQPRGFEAASARGVGLQLSGHTHGGQIFPMTVLVGMAWKYSRGLYREGDSHIYVSRGCGFWGPPARVGSQPEIVKLHLTA
ncbi:MAG: metallophosphoesterase [Myxococcales bacterium]